MGKLERMIARNSAAAAESIGVRSGRVPPPLAVIEPAEPRLKRDQGGYHVPLGLIDRDPEQPREDFAEEDLRALADNLKQHGQLQPCLAIEEPSGRYTLLDGERRWRAASLIADPPWESIACRLVKRADAGDKAAVLAKQISANHHREPLKPIELARALARLRDTFGWTQARIADEVRIRQSAVSEALCLVDLPMSVQQMVEREQLPVTTARVIGQLDDAAGQVRLARKAVGGKLTIRETKDIVAAMKRPEPAQIIVSDNLQVEADSGLANIGMKTVGPGIPETRPEIPAIDIDSIRIEIDDGGVYLEGVIPLDFRLDKDLPRLAREIRRQVESHRQRNCP
jgi:ParB/RepB/Spo0J family partition protein